MQKLIIPPEEKELVIADLIEQVEKANTSAELETIKVAKDKTFANNILKPKIFISANNLEKMHALVKNSTVECQWHGLVKRSKKKINQFWIYDILVFPQINAAASTDTDEDEYAEWLMEIIQDEDENKIKDLRFHGHSHVNMSVYSSSIDDTFQKELLANIKEDDYYIFFIMNKKREICMLLYDYLQNILFETKDIDLILIDKEGNINKWAKDTLKKNAKVKSYYSKIRSTKTTKSGKTQDQDPFRTIYDSLDYYGDFNPYCGSYKY